MFTVYLINEEVTFVENILEKNKICSKKKENVFIFVNLTYDVKIYKVYKLINQSFSYVLDDPNNLRQ